MLRELRIRDVAIIEDVAVEFGPGLNVLSGETGAGKSIILGALGLVLGSRGSAEIVRTGRAAAEVQARVDRDEEVDAILRELDVEAPSEDEGLLLRRVVTRAGRSRAYVGGSAVPVAALRRLAGVLVDYSSQHEHQVLLDETTHLGILDRFAGLQGRRAEVGERIAALRELLAERERLARLEREQRAREDYLRFQLEELDQAEPKAGEQEELEAERALLRSAEERAQEARAAEEALYSGSGSAVERLAQGIRKLRRLAGIDPQLAPALEGIESALIAVEDVGRDLADYARRARSSPHRLAEVEDRVVLPRRLARKHRRDVDALPALHEELRAELDDLAGLEERLDGLAPRIERLRAEALEVCRELSARRREAAVRLQDEVEGELASLAMERARFLVRFAPWETGGEQTGLGEGGGPPWAGSTGTDRAGFLLSANPGEEPRPLARVASGGELSRILLSIRRALAGISTVQTCVFDEVDSGMGGATAETVGRKLAAISREVQVLCITHQPQIAAQADRHLRVEKHVEGGRTRAVVVSLEDGEAVGELVRMLAGSGGTDAAEAFARELLARARAPVQ